MDELTADSAREIPCADEEPLAGSYFVSTYPPFSTWSSDELGALHDVLQSAPRKAAPFGLYVHIPFCVKRCRFCYYLSYAQRPPEQIDAYLKAVVREASMYRRAPALNGARPTFAYFGGGTPSLLSAVQISRLLSELQSVFPWDDVREATFECAPQTVTDDRIRALRDAGITRLSLGVQQLDDEVLRKNGRVHMSADVERAYPIIRRAGFAVVNIDLITGLLGETEETFFASLERVIEMQPESVTIYQLEIPRNTPLYHDLSGGELPELPPSWQVKHARLGRAFRRLEQAGYVIRSGYTAVRDPHRHRFLYQDSQYRGADLLGLGAASFSYLAGVHSQNKASLPSYLNAVAANELPLGRARKLSEEERLIREFILQLKLGSVRSSYFRTKFGVDICEKMADPLARMSQAGWLTVNSDGVTPTRAGLTRIDRLIPEFYLPQHRAVRYS